MIDATLSKHSLCVFMLPPLLFLVVLEPSPPAEEKCFLQDRSIKQNKHENSWTPCANFGVFGLQVRRTKEYYVASTRSKFSINTAAIRKFLQLRLSQNNSKRYGDFGQLSRSVLDRLKK